MTEDPIRPPPDERRATPAPVPVTIAGPTPIPVLVANPQMEPRPSMRIQHQETDPSRPARTTFQEDLTTAGQRRINLIWEYTQAAISIAVVLANMIVAVYHGLVPIHGEFPVVLSSALFLITGFYFSRTNHAAVGGVGKKLEGEYTGR